MTGAGRSAWANAQQLCADATSRRSPGPLMNLTRRLSCRRGAHLCRSSLSRQPPNPQSRRQPFARLSVQVLGMRGVTRPASARPKSISARARATAQGGMPLPRCTCSSPCSYLFCLYINHKDTDTGKRSSSRIETRKEDVTRHPTTTTCEAHLDHRLPSSHVKLKVHVCRLSGSGGGGKRGAPVCAAVCVLFCELLANEKELTRDTTL